jgi:hypothetical protein
VRILLAGLALTALVTTALVATLGRPAVLPGLLMGAVATVIELSAARWLRRGLAASTNGALQAFVAGMLFRLFGVGVFAGLVVWDRGMFPPLPTGLGYVGVVVPLLFLEMRSIR